MLVRSDSATLAFNTYLNSNALSNNKGKYDGMIKESKSKQFMKDLKSLFNYVYTVTPGFKLVHHIITFFRIMQFIGPSIFACSFKWKSNIKLHNFISVVSVLFNLLPPEYRGINALYFLIAYILLFSIFAILVIASAYYYKKNAKLPIQIPYAVAIFFSTANFVLHPIAIEFSFEELSKLFYTNDVDLNYGFTLSVPLISIVIYCSYVWCFMSVVSQTLTFRPMSMLTVTTIPQNAAYVITILLNLFQGFAASGKDISPTILLFINAIIYSGSTYVPFYRGGFVSKLIGAVYAGSAVTGALMCVIMAIFIITGKEFSFVIVISYMIIYIIMIIIFRLILMNRTTKNLILCDDFSEYEQVSVFKNKNGLINAAVDGMANAHPVCLNGTIFKAALEVWPKDENMWFLFAKFVAIYPDETVTLAWIYQSIRNTKLKGPVSKTIKEQCVSIAKQRESNLSPGLKIHLNSISKDIYSAKNKLRHVWDVVIQSNISDMELSIKKYYVDLEKCDANYKHLFRTFPNNKFVTRSYARFLKELGADIPGYLEALEKTRKLQRGIMINEDQTHMLGMSAFPNLPEKIRTCTEAINFTSGEMSTFQDTTVTEIDDDQLVQDESLSMSLQQSIAHLSIPSIRKTKQIRSAILLIYLLAMIAMFIFSKYHISSMTDILQYMNFMGGCRNNNYQISVTVIHLIYEILGVYNPPIPQRIGPKSLGGTYNSSDQLSYLLGKAVHNIMNLQTFNSYESNNVYLKEAQRLLFDREVNYTYFNDWNDSISQNLTVLTAFMDIVDQAQTVVQHPELQPKVVNTSKVLNVINNVEQIGNIYNKAFTTVVESIMVDDQNVNKIAKITTSILYVFVIISSLAALYVQLVKIQKDKVETYKCLTALPKNSVSVLVENLRVLKNEEGKDSSSTSDRELSKQEDNILKTFLTCNDIQTATISDTIFIIIGTIIFIVIACVSVYLFAFLLTYESKRMLIAAPHLDWQLASFNQFQVCQFLLQILSMNYADEPLRPHLFTTKQMEQRVEELITSARNYYHKDRFGGEDSQESPFLGYQAGLEKGAAWLECSDPTKEMTGFFDMINCWNIEGAYLLMEVLIQRVFQKTRHNDIVPPSYKYVLTPKDKYLDLLWTIIISPIYDALILPMYATIIPTIKFELAEGEEDHLPVLIVLLVLSIIFEVLVFFQVLNIEKHMRQTLYLLLHCPPDIVMKTNKVCQILNGNFTQSKGDNTKRATEFYDNVFQKLPDAVLIADPISYVIENANKSCERVFGTKIELEDFKEILKSKQFDGDFNELFTCTATESKSVMLEGRSNDDVSNATYEFSSSIVGGKFVTVIRDFTSVYRYNRLIRDERAKSEALLSTILPPSLVRRVESGEKNISFAVQQATISFMDIVSFTPWCGANEATKVMMTLNLLFKKLDEAMGMYPSMTKIKCIGDCYMAASGIFCEISQPSENAKDVVSFGLDSIQCIKDLDRELGEELQIRVGVNSGGPIVAGVLGIGKPTFEILGPAINMAQQMEHHGIPMNVHISRSVYELIYGDIFMAKERGTIEVKNGRVITYLVTGKK